MAKRTVMLWLGLVWLAGAAPAQPTPQRYHSGAVVPAAASGDVGQKSASGVYAGAQLEYQVYALRHKPAATVERILKDMLDGYGEAVHMVSDSRTNRLLLRGPAEAQRIAAEVIAAVDQPARLPGPETPQQTIQLTLIRAEQLDPWLRELLGNRLRSVEATDPQRSEYQLTDAAGRTARISIDWQRQRVQISAAAPLLSQIVRLVQALDSPPPAPGDSVRIVPLRRADLRQVREAIEAYRSGARPAARPVDTEHDNKRRSAPGNSSAPGNNSGHVVPGANGGQSFHGAYWVEEPVAAGRGANGVVGRRGHIVTCLFQPVQPQPPGAEQSPEKQTDAQTDQQPLRRPSVRQMDADVEVETLPDLDAIILRGRQRDVEQLRRIIEQIERLSAETQPVVDIYLLRHVNCEALADLVAQVSPDLVGGQQGRVMLVPLVKPNALLLIGWGQAVLTIKDLIAKLDQPISPHTQFRVYRLRYAPAAAVMNTVQNLFANRGGLAPQVRVVSDNRTNSLVVQAAPRDLAEVELLIERLDQPTGEAVRQARVFRLANSLAADVASVLQAAISGARPGAPGAAAAPGQKSSALELLSVDGVARRMVRAGLLDDVQITPDPRTNTLIVAAPAECMDLLAELIRQLDSPTAVAQIKVFRITNGDATALANTLRGLLPSAAAPAAALPGAEGETSLVPVRLSVDVRTNSIIAVGSQGDLAIIEALLIRLDQEPGLERKNAVYRLKNAPAADVSRTINEFLRTERQLQQFAPGAVSPFQQIESEVVVVPEVVSNALIISATPRYFDEIKQLVEKLDAEPPQVLIQVLIAEVALGDLDEFGVELGLQDAILFDRSLLGNLITTTTTTQRSTAEGIITTTQQNVVAATNEPGFAFNNKPLGNSGSTAALRNKDLIGSQGLSHFNVGRVNNELGFGGLVLSASSESVSVLIRALQESRRLEVLSRPQVMTLDNQPAFVQVGKRVPRIIGSAVTQYGQQNAIVLENVGLILGVTPRISPDGRVVMEVDAEKSEVGPVDEGIPVTTTGTTVIKSPNILLTTAQTTVSAMDGETIIIGGLITKSTQQTERKVPLLGDIPLVGALFRYNYNASRRTEMLIILTPHIVRSPEEAERVRRAEEARMHWCLGDVSEIHGTANLAARLDEHQVPVIYPDANPRGVIPKPNEQPEAPRPESIPPGPQMPLEPAPLPNGTSSAAPAVGDALPPEVSSSSGSPHTAGGSGQPLSTAPGGTTQPLLRMPVAPQQIERSPPVRSMVGPANSPPQNSLYRAESANGYWLPEPATAGVPAAESVQLPIGSPTIAPAQHLHHRGETRPVAQHDENYSSQPGMGRLHGTVEPGKKMSPNQHWGAAAPPPPQGLPRAEQAGPATRYGYSANPIPTDVFGDPSRVEPLQYHQQQPRP